MATRVKYDDGGSSSNAASEETLDKLVKAMEAMGGPAAGAATVGLAGKSKGQKAQEKASKDNLRATTSDTKATQDGTKATKKTTSSFVDLAKAAGRATAGLLGSVAGGISSAVLGVAGELMGAQTSIGAYTSHVTGAFGALGKPVQMLIGAFEGHMETFRDMASVGASAGNNLFQFQTMASTAGVSLEDFTAGVAGHSTDLAMAFGSVNAGTQRFSSVLGKVRKDVGKQFSLLGMSITEQTELTAEYMAQEARLGRTKGRTDQNLSKGVQSYIFELDKLTKLTGISRKEAAAAMRENQEDPMSKMMISGMDAPTKDMVNALFTKIEKVSSKPMADAIKRLMASNGVGIDDMTRGMVGNVDEYRKVGELLNSIAVKGYASKEEEIRLNDLLSTASKKSLDKLKEGGVDMQLQQAIGSTWWDGISLGAGNMMNFNKELKSVTDNIGKTIEDEDGKGKPLTAQDVLVDMSNVLRDQMVDKVMPKVGAAFTLATEYLEKEGPTLIKGAVTKMEKAIDLGTIALNKLMGLSPEGGKSMLDTVTDGIKTFFKDPEGTAKAVLKAGYEKVKNVITSMGTSVDTAWDSLGQTETYKTAQKNLTAVNDSMAALQKEIDAGGMTEEEKTAALKRMDELIAKANEYKTTMKDEKKDVSFIDKMSAFFSGINWVAVGGAVSLIGIGFAAVKLGLGLGAIAIAGLALLTKFLLIGSVVILAVGKAIEMVGSGIKNVAEGVKLLSEVDMNEDMKEMPGFLSSLAGPLTDLAAGGIVGQLGGGGLKKLALGIKEFQDIQVDNLAKAGPALESLYKGVSAFTGDSLLDKAGKFLGGLFGGSGSTSGMADIAEGLKDFKDVDAAGLEKIGKGLEGITGFVDAMKNADIDKTSEQITKLINNLKEYQKTTANMSSDMSANLSATVKASMSDSGASVDKLNSSMQTLIELVQAGNKIETKQLKALEER